MEHDDYDRATGCLGQPLYKTHRDTLVREVARAHKPSYLVPASILAAVAALGVWFGAVLV